MPPITPDPVDIPNEESENACSAVVENVLFTHSDSDSESENLDHDGYELLSQDPDFMFNIEEDDEDYNASSDVEESVISEANLNSSSNFSDSASQNTECSSGIKTMSEAHIETIKSVMKGITLPSSNLPQWASLVPEEEWKAALFSQMHERNLKRDCSDREVHFKQATHKNTQDVSNEALR